MHTDLVYIPIPLKSQTKFSFREKRKVSAKGKTFYPFPKFVVLDAERALCDREMFN